MHTGTLAANINSQTITGNVIANDTDPASRLIAVSNGVYGTASINALTGEVSYKLNANAAAQMGSGSGQVKDSITYTAMDSQGNSYQKTVEIVVVRQISGVGQYISDNIVEGEVHKVYVVTTGDSNKNTLEIALSSGDDIIVSNKEMVGVATNLGEGNNEMRVTGVLGIGSYSSITAGSGNDVINIDGTTGVGVTIGSSIDAGDGDNRITVKGVTAMDGVSSIKTGSGDDVIKLTGTAVYGMVGNSSIDAGGGNNRITVTGGTYGMAGGSTIVTGGGDDVIKVTGKEVMAMVENATINAGDGNNEIVLQGKTYGIANSGKFQAVTTGSGNDTITISADGGPGIGIGLYGTTVNSGAGNDTINVSGGLYGMDFSNVVSMSGDNTVNITGNATGMISSSSVITGGGDDVINVSGGSTGLSTYSSINAGDGNNVINVSGKDYGSYYSNITTGSGNDIITLTGNTAALGGKISTGDGSDMVIINGNLQAVTIDLGGGNDVLRLESGTIGTGTLLLGGENDTIDFDHGKLGDILSLGHALAANLSGNNALGGISSSTVKGFETLHLDLTGGDDIVDMSKFLQTLTSKGFTGSNAFAGAIITGDERDGALLNADSWTKTQSDVTIDNFDGLTFDRFTVINGLDTLEIYIQSGMM